MLNKVLELLVADKHKHNSQMIVPVFYRKNIPCAGVNATTNSKVLEEN
jgi:hypothetical protein